MDDASKTQRSDLIHNLAKEIAELHEGCLNYPQAFRQTPSADFDKFFSTISTQINKQREVRILCFRTQEVKSLGFSLVLFSGCWIAAGEHSGTSSNHSRAHSVACWCCEANQLTQYSFASYSREACKGTLNIYKQVILLAFFASLRAMRVSAKNFSIPLSQL